MKKSVAILLLIFFILSTTLSVGAQNNIEYDYSSFVGEWHKIDIDGLNGDVVLNILEVTDNNRISFSIDGGKTLTEDIHNNQVKWTENWWDGEMGLTLNFYDDHIHLQYSRYSLEWYTEITFVSPTIKPKRIEHGYSATLNDSSVAKTGDIIGYAKYTDISAYINHYPITSYNINDYTAVVAEDLRNYGFNVEWNGDNRSLNIYRNYSATAITPYGEVYKNSSKLGQKALPYLETDIATYVNGNRVESFNIDGKTIIFFEDLKPYGEVVWVPELRAIKMWITDLPMKDYAPIKEYPSVQIIAGNYNGGGISIPGSIDKIGQWNAYISKVTSNSINLSFGQSESDYYIDDMILYKQENGSYYGVGYSTWGRSDITIWVKSSNCISLTVSGNADQTGTEYLYRE